jgi:hypothetical protein
LAEADRQNDQGAMFFTFPEDAGWNAKRQAVEFGVEIDEYHGVVGVPRRAFQRLLPDFLGLIVGLLSGTDGIGTSPAKAAGPKPAPVGS